MAKIVLAPVTNTDMLSTINQNFTDLVEELQDKVLYRDNPVGETNTVQNDVDMDGNDIFNVNTVHTEDLFIDGTPISEYIGADAVAAANAAAASAAAAQISANEAAAENTAAGVQAGNAAASAADAAASALVAAGPANQLRTDLNTAAAPNGATLVRLNAFRTLRDKAGERVSVKDYGALGNGSTNDTAAIQAAEDALTAAGGGEIYFPKGIYIVGSPVIKKSNVTWRGDGLGSTLIRRQGGVSMQAMVMTTNAYGEFGTGSLNGPTGFTIADIQFDADKTSGGTLLDVIALYAGTFFLNNLEICNSPGGGLRTGFGIAGVVPHGYSPQSDITGCRIHDNDSYGVRYDGPSDPSVYGCQIYRNLNYQWWSSTAGVGTGVKFVNCHFWGSTFDFRQATTGVLLETSGHMMVNCVAEGSTVHQIHMKGNGNVVVGGNMYYLSDAQFTSGITLGDVGFVSLGNYINTRIDNCKAGAITFANNGGMNDIHVNGYNSGGIVSSAFQGSPALTDNLTFNVYGDVSVTNGQYRNIVGGGQLSFGAADSGGAGFRMMRVPN